MRKLVVPLLGVLLFISCKKHDHETKIEVCHQGQKEGTSQTITVSESALPAHLAHGDVLGSCVPTVTICNQIWMLKNLDVDHYRNGDPILQAITNDEWIAAANAETGAWCYYNNDPANGAIYGKLYNWYAVNDPRGLAPQGWHVPTDAEWTTLVDCLGGDQVAGGKMKSVGTIEAGTGLWIAPNTDASNSSGFTGLPGGRRETAVTNSSNGLGIFGLFWSSTEYNPYSAWYRILFSGNGVVDRDGVGFKPNGKSVRCLKD